MKLTIKPLEREHMPVILEERAKVQETLRTPFLLNSEMQEQYFVNVLSNRESHTRYWAFYLDSQFVGMGGVENIQNENRLAEISVLIFEKYRGQGLGELAVDTILDQAFNYLNLQNVWGECYYCGNINFWLRMVEKYNAFVTDLPARKYYKGEYHGSLYFNFYKDNIKK